MRSLIALLLCVLPLHAGCSETDTARTHRIDVERARMQGREEEAIRCLHVEAARKKLGIDDRQSKPLGTVWFIDHSDTGHLVKCPKCSGTNSGCELCKGHPWMVLVRSQAETYELQDGEKP